MARLMYFDIDLSHRSREPRINSLNRRKALEEWNCTCYILLYRNLEKVKHHIAYHIVSI